MARDYHVQGTKNFLYWGVFWLLLGCWAVRDGWFTTQSKIVTKIGKGLAAETFTPGSENHKAMMEYVKNGMTELNDTPWYKPNGHWHEIGIEVLEKGIAEGEIKASERDVALAEREIHHFTAFNISLTVICVIGTAVCFGIHFSVK